MKAGWLVGGVILALLFLGWSAWGDMRFWLVNHNAAAPTNTKGYGRAIIEFPQVAVTAEVPLTEDLKARGLGGRETLGDRAGMLFQYPEPSDYAFWMKDMDIPIDFIWIVNDRISSITPNVPPPSAGQVSLPVYRPIEPVTDILEVRAGFAEKYGLQAGDVVRIDLR